MTAARLRMSAAALAVASCGVVMAAAPARAAAQEPAEARQPVDVAPPGYVVGPEDVLAIVFWRERDLSSEVVVRPDGKISLPLINDVVVEGLTPDEVREKVVERAREFVDEPSATVVVKQINSRRAFITGNVERPGAFPLVRTTTVLQLIALAGGLREFANAGSIVVVRNSSSGQQVSLPFNYNEVKNGKNLYQNIELKPGDTVIVP